MARHLLSWTMNEQATSNVCCFSAAQISFFPFLNSREVQKHTSKQNHFCGNRKRKITDICVSFCNQPRERNRPKIWGDSCQDRIQSPSSLFRVQDYKSHTGAERSPSAIGAQEIYLEPPQSSDVIRPFKADRFQAFFQTALDAGEPTCSWSNYGDPFLGHGEAGSAALVLEKEREEREWTHIKPHGRPGPWHQMNVTRRESEGRPSGSWGELPAQGSAQQALPGEARCLS